MAQQRNVSVGVKLAAENYFAGLAKMQAETKKTATTGEQAFNKQKAAFNELGRASLVASGVFTAAFVAMVKASADFEQRMSQVQALSKATASQMDRLRASAFTAGKAFGLSATQVADAQIELTKAGVSVKDIIGGALPGALALAAAGQIDVSKATEIATTAMTQFKLSGKDVPHVADLLAAGADKSIASVESLGDSLNQSGQVASQFGLSVEDTVGTLTAFSKAGLNGSDAGTSFKTMLTQLASPTKQAQQLLDKYNITTYDTQGQFVGITKLADNLRAGLGNLSQQQRNSALSTIFGNDAIRASGVLYDLGGKKLQGYIDANNEAGFAALQASKKLDNLNGDVQKLGAAFQNDLIKSGSAGNDVLRGLTQRATGLLDVFSDLPKPIQGSALAISAVGAAVTAGAAGFLLLTPKVAAAKAAMADLNLTGKGLAAGFGKGGAIVLGLTAVASALSATTQQGTATAQQLNLAAEQARTGFKGIDKLIPADAFTGVTKFSDALDNSFSGNFAENSAGAAKAIDGLTFGLSHFSDVYKTNEGQIKAVGTQFAALASTNYSQFTSSFSGFIDHVGGGSKSIREMLSASGDLKDQLTNLAKSAGVAATDANLLSIATGRGGAAQAVRDAQTAAEGNAQALKAMSGSAADASVDISTLSKTIAGFGSTALDARGAERAFEQAIDDASDAAKKNGRTLNTNTQAGRDNQAALDGIASSAAQAASKILEQSGSQEQAASAIRKGRKAFIDAAVSMGLSRDAAKKLADQLNLIPSNVKTAVSVSGVDPAKSQVADLKRLLADINGFRATVYVNAKTAGAANAAQVAKNAVANVSRAGGGEISGPGPKGKDSVLAFLAPGEHVLTSKEVDRMGGQGAVYAFRRGLQAYAVGGAIGDAQSKRYAAGADVTRYTDQRDAAKRRLATLTKASTQADKAVEKAADAAAKISGKGTAEKKHAAELEARAARKRAADAKDRVDKQSKLVDSLGTKLDSAKQRNEDAREVQKTLTQSSEDFVSQERRGVTDPLSYVDQLRSMSRDDNYSATRQKTYKAAADKYEQSLIDLAKQSDAAATKLSTLKDSADSMRSSITSAIAGGYQLTGASAVTSTGSTVLRNGIGFQTTTSGVSADAIDAYYKTGAQDSGSFAADLKALAARGVDGRLLAELAGYGVAQGAPIAKALLSATTGQIGSINASYGAIQGNAATAAGTVTDYNYKAAIDAAQTVADGIAGQIAADSEKLRKLIASAFGLTGYAIGTANATPGLHLVGEKGPELLRFAGGEQVITAANTRALMAGATSRQSMQVSGPSSVTIVDSDGQLLGTFATIARGVSRQEIAADAISDSTLLWGKGT